MFARPPRVPPPNSCSQSRRSKIPNEPISPPNSNKHMLLIPPRNEPVYTPKARFLPARAESPHTSPIPPHASWYLINPQKPVTQILKITLNLRHQVAPSHPNTNKINRFHSATISHKVSHFASPRPLPHRRPPEKNHRQDASPTARPEPAQGRPPGCSVRPPLPDKLLIDFLRQGTV
jgi:hypothetical protein